MKVILADLISIEPGQMALTTQQTTLQKLEEKPHPDNNVIVISLQTKPHDTVLDVAISMADSRKLCRDLLTTLAFCGDGIAEDMLQFLDNILNEDLAEDED